MEEWRMLSAGSTKGKSIGSVKYGDYNPYEEIQVTIKMTRQDHELMKEDARAHGVAMIRFPSVLYRDWSIDRRPLRLLVPGGRK